MVSTMDGVMRRPLITGLPPIFPGLGAIRARRSAVARAPPQVEHGASTLTVPSASGEPQAVLYRERLLRLALTGESAGTFAARCGAGARPPRLQKGDSH